MRLLHVTPTYFPAVRYGGPIYSVHGLAKGLAALGHEVDVFTTDVDGDGRSPVALDQSVRMDGVNVHYFPTGVGRRLYRSPLMSAALAARNRTYDVIHAHAVFLWPTLAAAAAARKASVPYVISPRGMLWRELIDERSRAAKTTWISLFERRNVERAAAIHVTSDIEAEKLAELGFALPPLINLSNGVEMPSPYGVAAVSVDVMDTIARGPYVLSLGRINWKKNLIALIEAMVRVPEATVVIAGNDEDGHAAELRARARDLAIADRVHILDRQMRGADKEHLFANAAAFVLPSLSENLGNTVLEAMIRGRPVIVSRAAGVAEIVERHACGIVCAPEPGALADAIEALWTDAERAADMGKRGAESASADYSWKAIASRMADAYLQLCLDKRTVA